MPALHTDAEVHSFSRRQATLACSYSLGLLGWLNSWLLGIKRKACLMPLRI